MATEESYRTMAYDFMRGFTKTICIIIPNTTENHWAVFHPEYLSSSTQKSYGSF